MDHISNLPVRAGLSPTDLIPVAGAGRGSRDEKMTIAALGIALGVGGALQQLMRSVNDPNRTVTPPDTQSFALYVKDQPTPVILWFWSISNQNWFNVLS